MKIRDLVLLLRDDCKLRIYEVIPNPDCPDGFEDDIHYLFFDEFRELPEELLDLPIKCWAVCHEYICCLLIEVKRGD